MNPVDYDLIIFLGDYVDSFVLDDKSIISNFREIIRLKKKYPKKVKLLIGNHETSYLFPAYRASGYRPSMAKIVVKLLTQNAGLFQLAYQLGNILWTHAGIHQGFYDLKIKSGIIDSDIDLAATLNRLYLEG